MRKNWVAYALAALVCALAAGAPRSASAEFFGCGDRHAVRHVSYTAYNQAPAYTRHYAQVYAQAYAQARPRVTIHPRHTVRRDCRSWLTTEYRVSGPVVVPRMRCWWD